MLELIKALERWVCRISRDSASDPSEVDDYRQEACIVVIGISKRYTDRKPDELVLIAKRAIRNRFCDMARRRDAYVRYRDQWTPTTNEFPDPAVVDAVRYVIDHLPPEWKEYAGDLNEGLTVEEAREIHGVTKYAHRQFVDECRAMSWRVGGAT